jgi:hypothetical protein
MTIKNYHYYLLGGFVFVAWIFAVVVALQVAVKITS